jgi:hypothetical protein
VTVLVQDDRRHPVQERLTAPGQGEFGGEDLRLGDQEGQVLGVARGSDNHAPVAAGLSDDGDETTVRVKSARNICRALWLPRDDA